MGGGEWDAGIWTRAAVFQDVAGLFVGVQKFRRNAVSVDQGPVGRHGAFAVSKHGMAVDAFNVEDGEGGEQRKQPVIASPVRSRKRTFDEVADSDEEEEGDEYGTWAELEEAALASVEAAQNLGPAPGVEVVTVNDD